MLRSAFESRRPRERGKLGCSRRQRSSIRRLQLPRDTVSPTSPHPGESSGQTQAKTPISHDPMGYGFFDWVLTLDLRTLDWPRVGVSLRISCLSIHHKRPTSLGDLPHLRRWTGCERGPPSRASLRQDVSSTCNSPSGTITFGTYSTGG